MSREEKLHSAIREGDLDAVEKALTPSLLTFKKTDVNAVVGGWTALQRAVDEGRTDIADLLIAKGADINLKCQERTPLHVAVDKGHVDMVKLLLAKGADVDLKNKYGQTAEDLAQKSKNQDLIALFKKPTTRPGESQPS